MLTRPHAPRSFLEAIKYSLRGDTNRLCDRRPGAHEMCGDMTHAQAPSDVEVEVRPLPKRRSYVHSWPVKGFSGWAPHALFEGFCEH